ncbi:MAG: TolC family protein [Tepidibacter sp.]|jgi:outer membrane protein TolC|uniref:TolC family protein n=1 Tax=Tepidibacter sp. TaxID=2529387 RepID=UPI0025E3AD9C|nr:TolC family protein [Tepidibacter sp.]MCT4508052.1 TolC family protein [Tepidibacter sp.]
MKKLVANILLTFIILLTSTLSYADNEPLESARKISLNQAIEEAIKNSTQVKVIDLDIQIKEIELDKAKHKEKKYEDVKDYGFSLGTVQGFQLDANMLSKQAEYGLEEEKIKKNYLKEDIKYNVTRAYYGVLQLRDYKNASKDNLENVQRNRDNVNNKYGLGVASKSDLVMADISLNEAKANFEKAKIDLEKTYRSLNMILNYPLSTKLELISNFEEQSFNKDLDKDLNKAYESRFDIIKMNHNHELVKLDFETNSIKYPSNTYKYKTKERNLAKIKSVVQDIKKSVEFDIRGKYDNVENQKKQIELAKTTVEKAKEGVKIKESLYDAKMGTLLEVDNALNQLYKAQVALSRAVSNYNLAVIDYEKSVNIGKINN